MLKEKIFNFLARYFFNLNYDYLKAKEYNQEKLEKNEDINKNSLMKFENIETFKNGGIYSKGNFNFMQKEGEWQYFFKNSNILQKIILYDKNSAFEKEEYYPGGEIFKISRKTELKENIIEYYYKSGEIKTIQIYPNFLQTSIPNYFEYNFYINGQIKEQKRIFDKKIVGLYKKYSEDGILLKECFYLKDGTLEGNYLENYDNGMLKLTLDYRKGRIEGYLKKYYRNGQIKNISIYNNDGLVNSIATYDEKGN